jgi:hypothetical protein
MGPSLPTFLPDAASTLLAPLFPCTVFRHSLPVRDLRFRYAQLEAIKEDAGRRDDPSFGNLRFPTLQSFKLWYSLD